MQQFGREHSWVCAHRSEVPYEGWEPRIRQACRERQHGFHTHIPPSSHGHAPDETDRACDAMCCQKEQLRCYAINALIGSILLLISMAVPLSQLSQLEQAVCACGGCAGGNMPTWSNTPPPPWYLPSPPSPPPWYFRPPPPPVPSPPPPYYGRRLEGEGGWTRKGEELPELDHPSVPAVVATFARRHLQTYNSVDGFGGLYALVWAPTTLVFLVVFASALVNLRSTGECPHRAAAIINIIASIPIVIFSFYMTIVGFVVLIAGGILEAWASIVASCTNGGSTAGVGVGLLVIGALYIYLSVATIGSASAGLNSASQAALLRPGNTQVQMGNVQVVGAGPTAVPTAVPVVVPTVVATEAKGGASAYPSAYANAI